MARRLRTTAGLATAFIMAAAPSAHAAVPRTLIASDPFTNPQSQHAAIVEPDTFAFGSAIVAAAQSGRYFNGGASGIRYATSTDGGTTWTQGTLPGITLWDGTGGGYQRATDPAVAYDAQDGVWLVSTLALKEDATGAPSEPALLTSRSTDGGLTFGAPVVTAPFVAGTNYDKNWIVCDNHATLPSGAANSRYGNCYTTWDDNGQGNLLLNSTSTDGGLTWGPPVPTTRRATGIGGQPVVQPNGTVVVASENVNETQIIAYRSTNGGASWTAPVLIANVADHVPAGNLRSSPLPSAEVDAAGRVYVAWQDCRFRAACTSNDIVLSTSANGTAWTAPARVPIDAATSGADHFIPGLGVDPTTSAGGARLGLTYYAYADAACTTACALQVGYIQSNSGGASWGSPVALVDPFPLADLPNTTQGPMVGDYISTSWVGGRAFGAVAVARPRSPGAFSQGLEVPTGGIVAPGAP
ncbi:MAG TPA: sialidase family protein [Solirubrobacteraceae bacterium]